MADIHIVRQHTLGLPTARKIAYRWAEQAEEGLSMECTYEEGAQADQVCFSRAGAKGTLDVTADRFELRAKLGFLLGAFKDRIESEITKNLDTMLSDAKAEKPAAKSATKSTAKTAAKTTVASAKPPAAKKATRK